MDIKIQHYPGGSYAGTPWGLPITVRRIASGVWFVQAAEGFGWFLDRDRNASVPKYRRHYAGWYHDIDNLAVVAMIHRDVQFPMTPEEADYYVRHHRPEVFEEFHQCTILIGHSRRKERDRFPAWPRGGYRIVQYQCDKGTCDVYVSVKSSHDGPTKLARVPREEWDRLGPFGARVRWADTEFPHPS